METRDKIREKEQSTSSVNIPHYRLIEMLTYKAKLIGLKVIITEESINISIELFRWG